jgi:hypothetical protein
MLCSAGSASLIRKLEGDAMNWRSAPIVLAEPPEAGVDRE